MDTFLPTSFNGCSVFLMLYIRPWRDANKPVLSFHLYCNCKSKILFFGHPLSSQFFKVILSLRFDKTGGCCSRTRISNVRAAQGRNVLGYVPRMKTSKCLDAIASLELTQETKSVGRSLIISNSRVWSVWSPWLGSRIQCPGSRV